jgi:undecaprenyl-diphosphatase
MLDWLQALSHWFLSFADSEYAVWVLGISSFAESIFFPIPPDPLLIALAVRNPGSAIFLAAIVTIASVSGAVLGHWLGYKLGRPLLLKIVSQKKVDSVEALFDKYGAWAILIAAFTPIPYKVFAITAGVLELNLRSFIVASIVGRGARFFLIGILVFLYGEQIQEFIEHQFELLTIVMSVALVIGIGIFLLLARRRSRRNKAAASVNPPPETQV